jgi:hypothetical protein
VQLIAIRGVCPWRFCDMLRCAWGGCNELYDEPIHDERIIGSYLHLAAQIRLMGLASVREHKPDMHKCSASLTPSSHSDDAKVGRNNECGTCTTI